MKIGDTVRFLSETGGGKIVGFKGKDIVLVEDEDGFQIPTSIRDVVVVNTDDYSMGKMVSAKMDAQAEAMQRHEEGLLSDGKSVKAKLAEGHEEISMEVDDYDPADREVTFRPHAEERQGGNKLSAYLAFVPVDVKEITNTRFETYFVNDSNYSIHFSYLVAEGNAWTLRGEGEVEPNTKLFLEEFGREALNELGRITIQFTAFKRERTFLLKPVTDVQFRVDPVKFYKLHTFQENDFFEQPALLFTIVENDKIARPLVVDSKRLKEQMYKEDKIVTDSRKQKRVKDDGTLVVDLHATELLETTAGMNAADILHYQLDVFKKTLDGLKGKKGMRVVFIHGKGEGVLRHALIHELNYRYKGYAYQDASFQEYGYGATQITVK